MAYFTGAVVDPKIIFGKSLVLDSTNKLVKAGKFLDLPVLDHIIIAGK